MPNRNFLIGNFLPAYGSDFGRVRRNLDGIQRLSKDELERRFDRRSRVRRKRGVNYVILLQFGAVFALSALILAFNLEIPVGETKNFAMEVQELVTMEEIAQTIHEEKPPPPPRPPVPVIVPDDLVLDDDIFEFDAMLDIREALAATAPPPPPVIEKVSEPEIFMAVESMPELIGGVRALIEEVNYPRLAQRAGVSGTVIVQVVVGADGKPRDPKIIRGVLDSLDKEALRAVLEQDFVPGKQRGIAVPVYMNIPVVYRLR